MFMKKKLIVLLIIVLLVVTPIIVYFLTRGGGSDIAEGKYVIVNDTKFPDAYAVVKGKTIQFFNIDLNAYYQETMIEAYRRVEKSRTEPYTPMSDGELFRLTDLNSDFVDNAISFSNIEADKVGTNQYNYDFIHAPFGIIIRYDSARKTITTMHHGINIQFQKQK